MYFYSHFFVVDHWYASRHWCCRLLSSGTIRTESRLYRVPFESKSSHSPDCAIKFHVSHKLNVVQIVLESTQPQFVPISSNFRFCALSFLLYENSESLRRLPDTITFPTLRSERGDWIITKAVITPTETGTSPLSKLKQYSANCHFVLQRQFSHLVCCFSIR